MKIHYVVPIAVAALVTVPAFAATPGKASVHQAASSKTETVKSIKTVTPPNRIGTRQRPRPLPEFLP